MSKQLKIYLEFTAKLNSGAPRAKRACGAPWVNKSTHPRKFGNHVTDRPTERPTDRPSAPQAYQCLLSHFLARLGAQEKADYTSMLSSIDSCQNRVSADQYHLTVSRAQVSTHQGGVFFWSYPLTIYSFSNDRRLTFTFFKIHIKYVVFMSVSSRTIKILISNWPQTQSFFKIQAGKTFSYHGHVLVTLHVQFLCSDWLKFDRWVHA